MHQIEASIDHPLEASVPAMAPDRRQEAPPGTQNRLEPIQQCARVREVVQDLVADDDIERTRVRRHVLTHDECATPGTLF
jgi:hypothetical protein